MRFDYCVIGGGIVGLSTAMNLLEKRPGSSLLLLEKENHFAAHQTGHNSGVIHSGIYYTPGSLKAKLCLEGCDLTKAFCQLNGIPYQVTGKLIVATDTLESQRLVTLEQRATANGIAFETLSASELTALEPNIRGTAALLIPSTGIVDYKRVCAAMGATIVNHGGEIQLGKRVIGIREASDEVRITIADEDEISAGKLVVCGGLQSDRLARMAGLDPDCRIVPFRGEYYTLPASKSATVKHLIYPLPNPDLPFLGIHLTRMIDGSITLGPNAVFSLAREGYDRRSLDWADIGDAVSFGGFWKVVRDNFASGLTEFKNSIFTSGYLAECQKYCPSLTLSDLQGYSSGIRAQAVTSKGQLVSDFLFAETDRMVHVLNAPSPAATSAIPIGRMIANKLLA